MNSDTVDYEDACLIVRYLASMRPFAQSFDIYLTQVNCARSLSTVKHTWFLISHTFAIVCHTCSLLITPCAFIFCIDDISDYVSIFLHAFCMSYYTYIILFVCICV